MIKVWCWNDGMTAEWWNDIQMMEWNPNDEIMLEWGRNDGMTSEWWNDIRMIKFVRMTSEWWNDILMMKFCSGFKRKKSFHFGSFLGHFWSFLAIFGCLWPFLTIFELYNVKQQVIYPPCLAQYNGNCVLCKKSAEMCIKCADMCRNIHFWANVYQKHVFDPHFFPHKKLVRKHVP